MRRVVGTAGAAVLTLNGLVGSGIFAQPAILAQAIGPWSPFLIGAIGVAFAFLIHGFARLATRYQQTGGPVLYTSDAFGPFAAFQTGWLLYLGRVTAFAAGLNLLLDYAATLFSTALSGPLRLIVLLAIVSALAAVNVKGARQGMRTLFALSILKLTPLLMLATIGLFAGQGSAAVPSLPVPWENVGSVTLLVLFAFTGFEGALVPAGETRTPERTLPRSILAAALFVTILYVLLQIAYLKSGADPGKPGVAPLAEASAMYLGAEGYRIVTAAAVFSIAGNLAAILFAAPRMSFALAELGSLPKWFGKLDPRSGTPVNSILFLAALAAVLGATGSFLWLAAISTLARLLAYALCLAALPVLERREGRAFRASAKSDVLVGLALCAWASAQSPAATWVGVAVAAAVGALLFLLSKRSAVASPRKKGAP